MELKNKRILVTGGTAGLGYELANQLLARGSHIFICSRSQDNVDKALIRLNSQNVKGYACDISDYKNVQAMALDISNLDILINNAGIWLEGSLENNTADEISKVIDVNLKGLIYCTSLFLPTLKKKDESYLVNISSTSGIDLKANQSVYSASKWGVRGFTDSLKEDLKETSVKVVGVYPGGIKTDLFNSAGFSKDTSKYIDPKLVAEEIIQVLEQDKSFVSDTIVLRRTEY